MGAHSSTVAWEIPWTEEPHEPWAHKQADTTEWLNNSNNSQGACSLNREKWNHHIPCRHEIFEVRMNKSGMTGNQKNQAIVPVLPLNWHSWKTPSFLLVSVPHLLKWRVWSGWTSGSLLFSSQTWRGSGKSNGEMTMGRFSTPDRRGGLQQEACFSHKGF